MSSCEKEQSQKVELKRLIALSAKCCVRVPKSKDIVGTTYHLVISVVLDGTHPVELGTIQFIRTPSQDHHVKGFFPNRISSSFCSPVTYDSAETN